jgi:hypothetical protein
LAGDERRAPAIALFDDLHQIALLAAARIRIKMAEDTIRPLRWTK